MVSLAELDAEAGAAVETVAFTGVTNGVGVLGLEAGWKPSCRDSAETAAIVVAALGRVGRGDVNPNGDGLEGDTDWARRDVDALLGF